MCACVCACVCVHVCVLCLGVCMYVYCVWSGVLWHGSVYVPLTCVEIAIKETRSLLMEGLVQMHLLQIAPIYYDISRNLFAKSCNGLFQIPV